jgi:hypothetical protein
VPEDDPLELQRRLRHDPRDIDALRLLFRHHARKSDLDRTSCVSQALEFLGEAKDDEKTCFAQYRNESRTTRRAFCQTSSRLTSLMVSSGSSPTANC